MATRYRDQFENIVSQRGTLKVKAEKSESLMGAMSMTRKVLRFGPSIVTVKTVINNVNDLLEYKTT